MSQTPHPNGKPATPNGSLSSLPDDIPPGLRAKIEGAETDAAFEKRQQRERLARLLDDPVQLLEALPELYGEAVAKMVTLGMAEAVLRVIGLPLPVKVAGRMCAVCLQARVEWNAQHARELESVQKAVMAEVGATSPADPRVAQVDLAPRLPENLRPGAEPDGLPPIFDAVTTINGTEVCPNHHPAAVNTQGRLIAVPGVSVHAAAQLAMAGAPGMPGVYGA